MSKKKQKKVKSVLGVPIDFDLGIKIKEINIDLDKYKDSRLVMLIFLNLILVCTLGYYLSIICNSLLICISIFTILVCLIWSIVSYKKGIIKIKYTIYSNAIVKDFDDASNVGILSDLIGYRICKTLLDRYGKIKTYTLILRFKNKHCPKIAMTCINDDIDEIIDIINKLKKINKDKKQENSNSLISKLIKKENN